MANKEEVIFKVKAELEGFKKSMKELKKIAEESSKNIEKIMNMDLSDEGSKAGKTFSKGLNKELKIATDNIKNELNKIFDREYKIKIVFDTTDLDRVKRHITDLDHNMSSASFRASSSMNNNANAPNNMNTAMSAINSAALGRLTNAVNGSTGAVNSASNSVREVGNSIGSTGTLIKNVGNEIVFAGNSMNVAGDKALSAGNSIRRVGIQFDDASRILKSAVDPLKTISSNAADAGKKMRAAANVIIDANRMVKAAGDKFKEAGGKVRDTGNRMSGLGAKIESAANKISQAVSNINITTPSNITVNGGNMDAASKNIRDAATDIQYAATDIKDAVENMGFTSKDIKDASEDLSNAAKDIADAGTSIDYAGEDIRDAGRSIGDAVLDLRYASTDIENAANKIQNAELNIPEITIKSSEELNNIIKSVGEEIRKAFEDSIELIGPAITKAFDEAIKKLKSVDVTPNIKPSNKDLSNMFTVSNEPKKGTLNDITKNTMANANTPSFKNKDGVNPYSFENYKKTHEEKSKATSEVTKKVKESTKEIEANTKAVADKIKEYTKNAAEESSKNINKVTEAIERINKVKIKEINLDGISNMKNADAISKAIEVAEREFSRYSKILSEFKSSISDSTESVDASSLKEFVEQYAKITNELDKYGKAIDILREKHDKFNSSLKTSVEAGKSSSGLNFKKPKVDKKSTDDGSGEMAITIDDDSIDDSSKSLDRFSSINEEMAEGAKKATERIKEQLKAHRQLSENIKKAANNSGSRINIPKSTIKFDSAHFEQRIAEVKKELENIDLSYERVKELKRILAGLEHKLAKAKEGESNNKSIDTSIDSNAEVKKVDFNSFINEGDTKNVTEAIERIKEHIADLNSQKEALGSTIDELKNKYAALQNEIEQYGSLLGRLSVIQEYLGTKTIPTSMLKIDTDSSDEMAVTVDDNEADESADSIKKITDAYEELGEAIDEAIRKASDSVKRIEAPKDIPKIEAPKDIPRLTDGSDITAGMLAPLGEVERALGRVRESARRAGDSINNAFGGNSAPRITVIESTCRVLEDEITDVSTSVGRLGNSFSQLGSNVSGSTNNTFRNLIALISSLASKIKDFASNAMSGFRTAMSNIRTAMTNMRNSVDLDELEEARNTLNRFANDIKKNFPKIDKLANDIRNSFSNMFRVISRAINPFSILGNSIRNAANHFRRFGNEANAASGKIDKLKGSVAGLLGKLTMFFGLYELFGLMKTGTEDAIKYEAAIMNLQRSLGKASQGLIDFANTHAVALGLSKRQVAEYGNIFSVIMRDVNTQMAKVGDTADDVAKRTADMSQELLECAGIISGALGYDVEYVLEGLRSGLLGSSEAVDQFGLSLKVANLEQSESFKQVANGAKSWNDLTVAQQQYVITMEIINQTHAKYGSIMKNTASMHNQFLAQLSNTKLALGFLGKVLWTAILPPLTQLLALLEKIFYYAASALTALLELFGIQVDFSTPNTGQLENTFGGIQDTADDTSDSVGNIGDSAEDSAKKTEESAKKIKRALAGFDQINVLSLGEDTETEEPTIPENPVDLGQLTPVDPGDFGVQLPDLTPQTQANLQKFKDFIDKMKALLSELVEPFKAAWDELGFRWIQAWNRLKQAFGNFCKSLSDFLVSVWNNGGKEFVQHMAEIALAVGIAAMEIGGTILNSLAKLWEHLNPETNSNTQGFLDALNEVSVKLRDLILSLNGHLETLMLHGGQDVLNAMGDCFMNLGEAAVRGLGVVIDAVDGLLEHLSPLTNEITRNMLEAWENAFKSIGTAALAFADLLESALVNGGQEIVNSLGDLAMQISATLGTIVDIIADTATELFRHLDPATNPISAGALEAFAYFVDSIRGFVEMIGESFRTFMDNGGQEFVNNMGDIVLLLVDLAATVGGDLINAITGFFNSWAGQVVIEAAARALELLSSVIKGLLEILEKFSPIISAVVAAIGGFMAASKVIGVVTKLVEIFKTVGGALGLAKTAATALWGVLAANPVALVVAAVVALGVALVAAYNKFDGFREAVDGILEAWSGFFDALKGLFSNILNDITNIFQDIIDIIVGIFTGDGERVGEAVRSLITNILQLFGDLVLGIIDVGINLIEGLIKGIWEGIKALPEAIKGVVTFIIDFFKGLFGINSPSTVFAEFGVNLIEGLAEGITSALDLISDALKSIFDFVEKTVGKAWDSITEFFGGIWDSITDVFDKVKGLSIPKPKISWDSIKDTAGKAIDKVKEKVEKFKAAIPKPSLSWDDLKTTATNTLTKLKESISKFEWKLPKPKLPSFSVSGGKAPWGFMGKGSMPKISIKWNKDGGILTDATIFGMAGNTLLGGGEAGPK